MPNVVRKRNTCSLFIRADITYLHRKKGDRKDDSFHQNQCHSLSYSRQSFHFGYPLRDINQKYDWMKPLWHLPKLKYRQYIQRIFIYYNIPGHFVCPPILEASKIGTQIHNPQKTQKKWVQFESHINSRKLRQQFYERFALTENSSRHLSTRFRIPKWKGCSDIEKRRDS